MHALVVTQRSKRGLRAAWLGARLGVLLPTALLYAVMLVALAALGLSLFALISALIPGTWRNALGRQWLA